MFKQFSFAALLVVAALSTGCASVKMADDTQVIEDAVKTLGAIHDAYRGKRLGELAAMLSRQIAPRMAFDAKPDIEKSRAEFERIPREFVDEAWSAGCRRRPAFDRQRVAAEERGSVAEEQRPADDDDGSMPRKKGSMATKNGPLPATNAPLPKQSGPPSTKNESLSRKMGPVRRKSPATRSASFCGNTPTFQRSLRSSRLT